MVVINLHVLYAITRKFHFQLDSFWGTFDFFLIHKKKRDDFQESSIEITFYFIIFGSLNMNNIFGELYFVFNKSN